MSKINQASNLEKAVVKINCRECSRELVKTVDKFNYASARDMKKLLEIYGEATLDSYSNDDIFCDQCRAIFKNFRIFRRGKAAAEKLEKKKKALACDPKVLEGNANSVLEQNLVTIPATSIADNLPPNLRQSESFAPPVSANRNCSGQHEENETDDFTNDDSCGNNDDNETADAHVDGSTLHQINEVDGCMASSRYMSSEQDAVTVGSKPNDEGDGAIMEYDGHRNLTQKSPSVTPHIDEDHRICTNASTSIATRSQGIQTDDIASPDNASNSLTKTASERIANSSITLESVIPIFNILPKHQSQNNSWIKGAILVEEGVKKRRLDYAKMYENATVQTAASEDLMQKIDEGRVLPTYMGYLNLLYNEKTRNQVSKTNPLDTAKLLPIPTVEVNPRRSINKTKRPQFLPTYICVLCTEKPRFKTRHLLEQHKIFRHNVTDRVDGNEKIAMTFCQSHKSRRHRSAGVLITCHLCGKLFENNNKKSPRCPYCRSQ